MSPGRQTRRAASGRAIPVAEAASGIGLLIVAVVTIALLTGNVPSFGSKGPGSPDDGPVRTATPSNVVVVDPRADVPGMLVYVKAGNIWVQSGARANPLTSSGHDAMPALSQDGSTVYFIRSATETTRWPYNGEPRRYRLSVPSLLRVPVANGGAVESLLRGRFTAGTSTWSYFIRQPVPAPDGSSIALVTDGPNPTKSDVVLKLLDPATGVLTDLGLSEVAPLGHQDPAWSPDGRYLLYVKNIRQGSLGEPVINRYDTTTKKATTLSAAGYATPAWSPDGRFVAATRTTTLGTDVVILDAATGAEVVRVTSDERSFDPVWSPAGNAIAFLSLEGGVADLWLVDVDASGPVPRLGGAPLQLTISAGLDPSSRPAWFIPADQLPTPPPTATPTAVTPLPTSGTAP